MINITEEEFDARRDIYKNALQELMELHGRTPTVLEVCLYIATMMDEDTENILKIFKEEINKKL